MQLTNASLAKNDQLRKYRKGMEDQFHWSEWNFSGES